MKATGTCLRSGEPVTPGGGAQAICTVAVTSWLVMLWSE